MERTDLAIGVRAMTSTLKGSIDLTSYFIAARDLRRDYEFISTKLDIKKALLLQQAHQTNILEP